MAAKKAAESRTGGRSLPDIDAEIDKIQALINRLDEHILAMEIGERGLASVVRERASLARALIALSTEQRQADAHDRKRAKELTPDELAVTAIQIATDLPIELRRKVAAEVTALAEAGILGK
jgi:hypothetical protein